MEKNRNSYSKITFAISGFFIGLIIHYIFNKLYFNPQKINALPKTDIITRKTLIWTILSAVISSLSDLLVKKANKMAGLK